MKYRVIFKQEGLVHSQGKSEASSAVQAIHLFAQEQGQYIFEDINLTWDEKAKRGTWQGDGKFGHEKISLEWIVEEFDDGSLRLPREDAEGRKLNAKYSIKKRSQNTQMDAHIKLSFYYTGFLKSGEETEVFIDSFVVFTPQEMFDLVEKRDCIHWGT